MITKQTWTVSRILACSIIVFLISGCDVTLGPKTEVKTIIVKPGSGVEVLSDVVVNARLLSGVDGNTDIFRQDIGGWIAVHPDHWQSVKNEINRLREKCGEKKQQD
jgi:hypothetical protein